MLIALHARKSARSALAFARAYPERRLIVVLTGTDLYRDLPRSRLAHRALQAASSLVTLQRDALRLLPRALRAKATPIVQSAVVPARRRRQASGPLRVSVLGHLRHEKDPLRVAYALARLPSGDGMTVTQAGAALDERFARRAQLIATRERRYRWLGDVPHARALRILSESDLLALTSRMEGGANVLSEAIAAGVPVIASRISGTIGVLGRDYPGYFPVGDTGRCAALLHRCVTDPAFLERLRRAVRAVKPLVKPARERALLLRVVEGR